jgi:hypothetical protein
MKELVRRNQVQALEAAIRDTPGSFTTENNEHIQTQHHFAEQVYGRQFSMRQGVVVTGKIHKYPCLNVIAKGRVVVTSSSDDVAPGTVLDAGTVWVSLPGTKRAVYALEDTVWVTAHMNPTNTRDMAAIEAALIAPDFLSLDKP